MTLFINSSPHCRGEDDHDEDTYLLDSKNSIVRHCGRLAEDNRKNELNQREESVLERLSPNDAIHRAEARSPSASDCFEVEADLVTVSFSASCLSPRLTILVSTKKLRRWHRARTHSSGGRGLSISTNLDARVCGALVTACHWDHFRQHFVHHVIQRCDTLAQRGWSRSSSSPTSELLLMVGLRWPTTLPLDAAFSRRVLRLLHARLDLEIAMAWLSTLGGGFSALGDYYGAAVDKAQKISLAQMQLAKDMGDPIVLAKSWLWFSLALIQKGQLATARWIVRRQLRFSRTEIGRLDPRLKNMCKGVLSKIRFLNDVGAPER